MSHQQLEISLDEFKKMLGRLDFAYEYSDDYKYWEKQQGLIEAHGKMAMHLGPEYVRAFTDKLDGN